MASQIQFRFRQVVEDERFRADYREALERVADKDSLLELVSHVKWYVGRNAHVCRCIPGTKSVYVYTPRHRPGGIKLSAFFILPDSDTVKLCSLDLEVGTG